MIDLPTIFIYTIKTILGQFVSFAPIFQLGFSKLVAGRCRILKRNYKQLQCSEKQAG